MNDRFYFVVCWVNLSRVAIIGNKNDQKQTKILLPQYATSESDP
jgi:hypothetical protein